MDMLDLLVSIPKAWWSTGEEIDKNPNAKLDYD